MGKGYATEAAYASIKYGFEKLCLQLSVGRAEVGNIGPWKVLEKCGLTYISEEEIEEYPHRTYEILHPSVR